MRTLLKHCLLLLIYMAVSASAALNEDLNNWRVSNDTVMGGISSSSISASGDNLVFRGQLRLENNGGFTSVWRQPSPQLLFGTQALKVKVKGDGRTYQLRLRTKKAYRISYSAPFKTQLGEWSEHTFDASDFIPVWRGRRIVDAPELTFDDVQQVGFLLGDKKPGAFVLEIEQIVGLVAS